MIDTTETRLVPASELREGDLVDLESCPYLKKRTEAPYLYATITSVERETPDCVAVSYEGIDTVGYKPNQMLRRKNYEV